MRSTFDFYLHQSTLNPGKWPELMLLCDLCSFFFAFVRSACLYQLLTLFSNALSSHHQGKRNKYQICKHAIFIFYVLQLIFPVRISPNVYHFAKDRILCSSVNKASALPIQPETNRQSIFANIQSKCEHGVRAKNAFFNHDFYLNYQLQRIFFFGKQSIMNI